VQAETLEAAGEYEAAAKGELLASDARRLLHEQLRAYVACDHLLDAGEVVYETRRLMGHLMRAAYASVRSETR
jgi:hypothetical protein